MLTAQRSTNIYNTRFDTSLSNSNWWTRTKVPIRFDHRRTRTRGAEKI